MRRSPHLTGHVILDRPHQHRGSPACRARRIQQRLNQERSRRLPVGPGNPGRAQPSFGMPIERRRYLTQRRPPMLHQHPRHTGMQLTQPRKRLRGIRDNPRRTLPQRGVYIPIPVRTPAAHRHKHRPRNHAPRVILHASHFNIGASTGTGSVVQSSHASSQLIPLHIGIDSTVEPIKLNIH